REDFKQMKQLDHIQEIRDELKKATVISYEIKADYSNEKLLELLNVLEKLIFLESYAALPSSAIKKIKEILKPYKEISELINAQIREERGLSLLQTQLYSIAAAKEKRILRRIEKKLKKTNKDSKKILLKNLNGNLSRMDLEALDAKLEKLAENNPPDMDKQRNVFRKKYLKALFPIQIFNAEGQQSRSSATFTGLKFALHEILLVADYYVPEEEEARENLMILQESLRSTVIMDSMQKHLYNELNEEVKVFKKFFSENINENVTDWKALLNDCKEVPIKEYLHTFDSLATLRDTTIHNFLMIWEELEYKKTWFIIFNQSFS
ncbi:MAG: hypothetical protein KAI81_08655, partial [Candidatus Marinimicrobia bacterium]|nr:hypothetical protein [Candidatus Neomarinimicrobiota bacterium]